ncbi:uncharacterized protein [Watersipora subatra]|uniref:uncharacterized protein n=1 Tax=Watersipora subatra TaxID=2589382 RepID=UPI00355C7DD7
MRTRSIPQLELNAAVLSKRARRVLEEKMRYEFDQVFYLIDSETVLNMVSKVSTRFKTYEGVCVGEIQAAANGDMSSWFLVNGKDNIADWLTRPRLLQDLHEKSDWLRGLAFLYTDLDSWEIQPCKSFSKEQNIVEQSSAFAASSSLVADQSSLWDYKKFSSAVRLQWTVARVISVFKQRSFEGMQTKHITTETLDEARRLLIKDVQSTMSDLKSTNKDDAPQWLLPCNHEYTRLLMKDAHEVGGHRGRDGTLARFRGSFWTSQGAKLAKTIKNNCQLYRVRDAKLLVQQMGQLPLERLKPAPPFNNTMVDLFGPYLVKGEVQKRTSGKTYGVLFTDLYSRAVHNEVVFSYDTESFLMALTCFVSIIGWPEKIFSDPGTQLVVEKELATAWKLLDRDTVYKMSVTKGTLILGAGLLVQPIAHGIKVL